MKIFALLLAMLVLVQSAWPCADTNVTPKAKIELNASTDSGDNHEDACSPFCICTCCAGFSLYCLTTAVQVSETPIKIKYTNLNALSTISIALPVWQPPQLG
jgi:uncharacterized protein DUF6660